VRRKLCAFSLSGTPEKEPTKGGEEWRGSGAGEIKRRTSRKRDKLARSGQKKSKEKREKAEPKGEGGEQSIKKLKGRERRHREEGERYKRVH